MSARGLAVTARRLARAAAEHVAGRRSAPYGRHRASDRHRGMRGARGGPGCFPHRVSRQGESRRRRRRHHRRGVGGHPDDRADTGHRLRPERTTRRRRLARVEPVRVPRLDSGRRRLEIATVDRADHRCRRRGGRRAPARLRSSSPHRRGGAAAAGCAGHARRHRLAPRRALRGRGARTGRAPRTGRSAAARLAALAATLADARDRAAVAAAFIDHGTRSRSTRRRAPCSSSTMPRSELRVASGRTTGTFWAAGVDGAARCADRARGRPCARRGR